MQLLSSIPSTDELSDVDVVARVLAGQIELFEVLMRRHNQRLFRAARAILKDDAEAEDVVQEAYVRAFVDLSSFEGRAQLSTWLTKITIHEAGARRRRRHRMLPIDDADDIVDDSADTTDDARPDDLASAREMAIFVEEAIDRLPEPFRAVLMLRAVEGMSGAETAECLGVVEETVKTRLFRARALLSRDLERRTDASFGQVHRFLAERCDRLVLAVLSRIASLPVH